MEQTLGWDARFQSKDKTADPVERFFDGRIHHHITLAQSFLL